MDNQSFQNPQMPQTQPMTPAEQQAEQIRQAAAAEALMKKSNSGLFKTIAIIVLSLVAVTFIGLFVWMSMQYSEIKTGEDSRTAAAVAEARREQEEKDLAQYAEEEKYPLRAFAGPADYGQLSFEYPKTWSVYVASDASKGGDYAAYFNPLIVNTVSDSTVNALRVVIRDTAFETVVAEYQRYMEQKDSNLSVESVTVGGTAANRYTGTIPKTDLNGVIVIFKIRDKTAILQTDAMLFVEDFNKLLETVQFNA